MKKLKFEMPRMKYPLDTPVTISQGNGIIHDYSTRYAEYTIKLENGMRVFGIKEDQIKSSM